MLELANILKAIRFFSSDTKGLRDNKNGKATWKKENGYHRRSIAENTMFRFKTIFSDDLKAITFESQCAEAFIKYNALKTMTSLGMSESYVVRV